MLKCLSWCTPLDRPISVALVNSADTSATGQPEEYGLTYSRAFREPYFSIMMAFIFGPAAVC